MLMIMTLFQVFQQAGDLKHVPGCKWIYADKIFKEVGYWRTWRFFKNSLISLTGYGYNPASDHSITEYILDLEDILV